STANRSLQSSRPAPSARAAGLGVSILLQRDPNSPHRTAFETLPNENTALQPRRTFLPLVGAAQLKRCDQGIRMFLAQRSPANGQNLGEQLSRPDRFRGAMRKNNEPDLRGTKGVKWYARADSNGRPFAPELSEPPLSLPAVTWVFNNLGRLLSLSWHP